MSRTRGFASAAEAEAAIEDREVYGAIVVSPDGPEVLIGSAARGASIGSSILPLVIVGILTGGLALLLAAARVRRPAAAPAAVPA